MQILFLGTAAYEGFPNPFCEGDNCSAVRGGRCESFRLTSAVLLNNDLLIDFGPNIMAGTQKSNVSLFNVATLLVTHSHSDHLYLPNFGFRKMPYNRSYERLPVMTVLSNSTVLGRIAEATYYDPEKTVLLEASPFEKMKVNGYTVTPIPAVHKAAGGETPLIYIIERDGTSLFYATDTGPLDDECMERISKTLTKPVDMIALDATMGLLESNIFPYHHSFYQLIDTVRAMMEFNILNDGSRIYAHHFSHAANPPHEELEKLYASHGISVTFDGLRVEL